jgi:putative permease
MAADNLHAPRELFPLIALCLLLLLLLFFGGAAQIVIIAALLSYILDPVVTHIEARGISRGVASFLVLATIIGTIVVAGIVIVPLIFEQVQSLQSGESSAKAAASILQLQDAIRGLLQPIGMGDFNLIEKVEGFKRGLGEKVVEFVMSDFVELIITTVTIPFMMFFLMKDGRDLKKGFIELVPNRYFEFVMDLLYKMDTQLGNYLRSQFIDAMVFGLLSMIALWILNVPYFLFIGAFAGFANLIPYVGPLAGMLPAFVVSVMNTGSISSGVSVIIAYVILKMLDDFLVQPLLVSRGVELHPLFVLVAIMIGGGLYGILGMLLAVPAAGFLKVAFRESLVTYRKYRLN